MTTPFTISLVGFPNSGKSTLFNQLCDGNAKTGNWTGVTVAAKQQSTVLNNKPTIITDLPGVPSLTKRQHQSQDLSITHQFIANNQPDLILNVIDATQLKRQLYLTTQLLELGLPVLVVLNKTDRKEAPNIDVSKLQELLGCTVVKTNSLSRNVKDEIAQAVANYQQPNSPKKSTERSQLTIPEHIRLELGEKSLLAYEQELHSSCQCETSNDHVLAIMQARYEFIQHTLAQVQINQQHQESISDKLDHIILHPWLGVPFFLGMMYLLFMFAINVGGAFIDFFDIVAGAIFVDYPTQFLTTIGLPNVLLTLIEGFGKGIQTVATFIPIIASLFIGLSLLESSGYLARAAFVVDSLMQKLGLPGKAFVPLIVGFGCTVPAVMSARILDSERERITTIMMSPFMSCGARLPVYALFAAAFFPESGQNIVFLLYLIGIAAAILTGLLLKATVLQGKSSINILELPLYEMPKLSYLVKRVAQRTKSFIKGAGKTIVIVVCILNFFNSLGVDGEFGHQDTSGSILSQGAKVVTPLLKPLGVHEDNWQASVGIITGLFAKEALVATFNSLYSDPESGENNELVFTDIWQEAVDSIGDNLMGIEADDPLGTDIGDVSDLAVAAQEQDVNLRTFEVMQSAFAGQIGAFSYLLFILLYTPCAAAMGAIKSEVGNRWALFAAIWSFSLAYFVATLVYQFANFSVQPVFASVCITLVFIAFTAIYYWLKLQGEKILTIPISIKYS